MNKEELLGEIEELPLFELKGVGVKEEEEWVEQPKYLAVTETTNSDALAFVGKYYKLVQFKEMFRPIVEKLGDCRGELIYYHGFSIMDVFPEGEAYQDKADRIGIVAYNSVNKTSALNIRFCVEHNGRKITIPKKVASFRKMHVGNVGEMTQDYISVITQIKDSWSTIVEKFINFDVAESDLLDIASNFKLDDRAIKVMEKEMKAGKQYNLWSFCMAVFDYLSKRSYKSEVHRRKRLDKFVNCIFDYGLIIEL